MPLLLTLNTYLLVKIKYKITQIYLLSYPIEWTSVIYMGVEIFEKS